MYLGNDNIPRVIVTGGGSTNVVHIRLTSLSGETSTGSSLGSSQTNGLNELYVKKVDVEGSVTVRNASGSASEPALELLGSGTYLRAADTLTNNLRFEVSDNAFTYDSPNGQRFAVGSSGTSISNNGTGDTLQLSKYDSSGSALKLFVFEATASAITVNNEDYGVDTFVLGAMGEVTHQSLWSATEAFKIMGPASDKLFVVDNTNSSVNIGNPAADSTGVVFVLDTKNTSGDPTGRNGAMYYNSNLGKFRCYEAGAWKNCIASSPSTAIKTVDQTINTTSLTNDTDLVIALDANSRYRVSGVVSIKNVVTGASYYNIFGSAPSGANMSLILNSGATISGQTRNVCQVNGTSSGCQFDSTTVGSSYTTSIEGIITTGATAGNFNLRYNRATTTGSMSIEAGSILEWTKL